MDEFYDEEDELQTFRETWRNEVAAKSNEQEHTLSSVTDSNVCHMKKASELFQRGIDFERNGKLSEAVQCYRQATQLDPEIEQHMSETLDFMQNPESSSSDQHPGSDTEDNDLVKQFTSLDVSATFPHAITVMTQSMHITQLPEEVIINIFRWVASANLDLAAIETLSEVSRRFYLLARDQRIWHAACQRLWGIQTQLMNFKSWRAMFIERPQVRLDGVYISKVSYFRQGDPTLMFKPFYCVEYYRYIRFCSNGQMLFFMTPEEPINVVSKFSLENAELCNYRLGQYKLTSSPHEKFAKVTAILMDAKTKQGVKTTRKGILRGDVKYIITDKQYFVDLEVTSSSSKKRFNKLSWAKYSCRCVFGGNDRIDVNEYNLSDQFPPFYFSRVLSFNEYSHEPL